MLTMTSPDNVYSVRVTSLEPQHRQNGSEATLKKVFCDECNHDFGKVCNYNKHRRDKHEGVRYSCQYRCGKSYSRNHYRLKHEAKVHKRL